MSFEDYVCLYPHKLCIIPQMCAVLLVVVFFIKRCQHLLYTFDSLKALSLCFEHFHRSRLRLQMLNIFLMTLPAIFFSLDILRLFVLLHTLHAAFGGRALGCIHVWRLSSRLPCGLDSSYFLAIVP